jgi:ABC-type multidrug transport system fused ATPase/permease subunit
VFYFSWIFPLLRRGARRTLSAEDLYAPAAGDSAHSCAEGVRAALLDQVQKEARKHSKMKKKTKPSLCGAYMSAFGCRYWTAGLLLRPSWLVVVIFQVFSLRQIVRFVSKGGSAGSTPDEVSLAALGVAGLFFCSLAQPVFINNLFVHSVRSGLRARAATTSLIWERLGRMKSSELQRSAAVLNLAEVDTARIVDGFRYGHFAWAGLLVELPVVTAMLLLEVGPAALFGIAILFLAIPMQAFFAKHIGRIQGIAVKKTDTRARLMGEILSGIELVKVNSWEDKFSERVNDARAEEVARIRLSEVYKSCNIAVFQATPLIGAAAVFAVKTLVWGDRLESASTFSALAWFNIMFRTLIMLPRGVSHAVEAMVSTRRIERFLFSKDSSLFSERPGGAVYAVKEEVDEEGKREGGKREKEQDREQEDQGGKKEGARESNKEGVASSVVLSAKRCSWSWNAPTSSSSSSLSSPSSSDALASDEGDERISATQPASHAGIRDISFELEHRSLLTVVGEIGSGKTSLLCALLGELHLHTGDLQWNGSATQKTLYVPQMPYVVNAPLWENITFGLPWNRAKFDRVIKACALESDIASFPDGASSEIGERGVTLSGGQNQRVALARACYAAQDGDVVLCDDVLSALDATVGAAVFRDVLSNDCGILRNTTRILATHALWSTKFANSVLSLHQDGSQTSCIQQADVHVHAESEKTTVIEKTTGKTKAETLLQESPALPLSASDMLVTLTADSDERKTIEKTIEKTSEPQELIKAEAFEEGTVGLATWAKYLDAGGGRVWWSFILLSFVVTQSLRIACDWWIAAWTDNLFNPNKNETIRANGTETAMATDSAAVFGDAQYAGIYFGIVLLFSLLVFGRTLVFTLTMLQSSTNLHNRMFGTVLHATMNWFWQNPVGRILNRFTRDIDAIDRSMIKSAQDWMNFMTIAIGAVITMCAIVPALLAIVVPLLFVFGIFTRFYVATSRQLKRLAGVTRSPIFRRLDEYMRGLMVVRSLGVEDALAVPFQHAIDLNVNSEFLFEATSRWLGTRLDSLSALTNGLMALFAFYYADTLDPGLIGVALVQSLSLSGVLQYSIRQAAEVESLMTSVERVSSYGELVIEDEALPTPRGATIMEKEKEKVPTDWPSEGKISVKDLQLRYRESLPLALRGVSFELSAGHVLGVVGRTGSGKSSLMTSFFRLVEPSAGHIIIDGIDILDRRRMPLHVLRRRLTVISQMPILFHGTLRSNVDPFAEHSDDDVLECLRKCQLSRLAEEGGCAGTQTGGLLEVSVSEGGQNFSAGERQLICVARALLRKPKLLLLDEASSNIDPETDAILQKMVREEFKNCTKIIIAHRLGTVVDADSILVLEAGLVTEHASPKELLDNPESHLSTLVDSMGETSAAELRERAAANKVE